MMNLWSNQAFKYLVFQYAVAVPFLVVSLVLIRNPRARLPQRVPGYAAVTLRIVVMVLAGLYLLDELSMLFWERMSMSTRDNVFTASAWYQKLDSIMELPVVFWLTFLGSFALLLEFAAAQTKNVALYDEMPHERLRSVVWLL